MEEAFSLAEETIEKEPEYFRCFIVILPICIEKRAGGLRR